MSFGIYTKIYNFLVSANHEQITAFSVIYQAIDENPWILKNDLRDVVHKAVSSAKNYVQNVAIQQKLLAIPLQVIFELN